MSSSTRGGGDQERCVDSSDERRPRVGTAERHRPPQAVRADREAQLILHVPRLLQHFLCALLNLVDGGGGDRRCKVDPAQGLLCAGTLSRRLLLAFAQARAGAGDPLLTSDEGVRRVQPLQATASSLLFYSTLIPSFSWKENTYWENYLCGEPPSGEPECVTSSHGLLTSIKVVIGRYQA